MAGPDCVRAMDMGQQFGLPHSEVSESGFRAVTWPDVVETRLWRPRGGSGQTLLH